MDINQFKVNQSEKISLVNTPTHYKEDDKEELMARLESNIDEIRELQQKLMAEEKEALIFAIQALDAAGKDEAERYLFSRLSSQNLVTASMNKPNKQDQKHDFLRRLAPLMPERGEIGVLNRSHYEDVIGARVHDSLAEEPLPDRSFEGNIWEKRYEQIKHFEAYAYDNGFSFIKIYLHISKEVQKERLLERIENHNKQWEFSFSDLDDRQKWKEHMAYFEECFQATSTDIAPWFVIPADDGDIGRYIISEILLVILKEINPDYPELSSEEKEKYEQAAKDLRSGKYD